MDIRVYQERDRDEVVKLWRECGLVTVQNDPYKDIDRKLAVSPELFLVGVVNQQVVASVMGGYDGHRGWINYLAVSPNQQRKGYGEKIMRAVEQRLEAQGCPKINLQVRSTNQAVVAFYNAVGYGEDAVISLGKRLVKDN